MNMIDKASTSDSSMKASSSNNMKLYFVLEGKLAYSTSDRKKRNIKVI